MKQESIIFLKGFFMGIADIIPGISGGTIALITGIYERLVFSISKIDFKFLLYLLRGKINMAKKNFMEIDFRLFIPLLSGIAIAFLIMTNLIYFLLHKFTALTYAFFFGLILASSIFLYKRIKINLSNLLLAILGFIISFIFVGINITKIGHSNLITFLSGVAAICAMILPGISGAFILLFLNQYEYMLYVLRNFMLLKIFLFCIGALIGILLFSRFLKYMLRKWEMKTISFLIGFMLGALRLPYLNIAKTADSIFLPLLFGVLGFLTITLLEIKLRKFFRWSK